MNNKEYIRCKRRRQRRKRNERFYKELSKCTGSPIEELTRNIPFKFVERELACIKQGSYYNDFYKTVIERADGKCELTGLKSRHLQVHHLNGYHWFTRGRIAPDNAVAIDKKIHRVFHKIYGKEMNTRKQWNEFQMNYENGNLEGVI